MQHTGRQWKQLIFDHLINISLPRSKERK